MSLPNRPAYQKPTKSSSSSGSSAGGGGGGGPGIRWNGNYSAGVSPVRGLSPVRGSFHGVLGRQEMELARSHTNPLFNSRTSDIGRGGVHTTPTKACRECKENRDKLQEPWKVPGDKVQHNGKILNSSTPTGKSTKTASTMRFTTPPKPVAKRKILAENREVITTACPLTRTVQEEAKPQVVAPPPPRREVIAGAEPPIVTAVSHSRNDKSQIRAESDGLSSSACSPEHSTATREDSNKPKSPLVSIEELQKRIQKFLKEEGGTSTAAAADVSVPEMLSSPRQSTESLRRSLSGTMAAAACSEESSSSLTGVIDEAPFQPVVAPYSPRPEFRRARKSPSMEGNVVSPLRGEAESLIQEKTTTTPKNTYDPKNNFLSPRPQFLRYRPLRRLELLRKSAEGTLGDLDLESPATDAESSRLGSEKDVDEKEVDESESQDVSQQEVQSLKSSSSVESPPPRCKVSSHELFKSAAAAEEETGEPEQQQSSISSVELPPDAAAAAGVDVPPTDSKFDYLKEQEEELLEEDAENLIDDSSSPWYYNACCIVTAFAVIALLVVASGSPGLLPISLHQNHISHLWKTSKATEPIRQFLQTTEGLWTENSSLSDFSLSSPDMLRVDWVHIPSLIQSHVDLTKVVETGKNLWSSCMDYSARIGQLMNESYASLRAALERETDYSSRNSNEEVNEWDWVPDYEFVVPRDMFDPVEAYANLMARVEVSEAKSLWTSLIKFYAKHFSIPRNVEEDFDSNIDDRNASLCPLSSARPTEDQVILSFRLPAAAPGRVIADIPISKPSQKVEPTSRIPEQREEITPQELNAVSGGKAGQENRLLSVQNDDQDLEAGDTVVLEPSSTPDIVGSAEIATDAVVETEIFVSPTEEEIPLSHGVEADTVGSAENATDTFVEADSHGVEGVQLSHAAAEDDQLAAPFAEDDQLLEPASSQDDQPVPFQECLQGDCGAEAVPVPSSPKENDVDTSMPLETKPSRSLFLEELIMHPPNFRTAAAIFTSLLLTASVALLVFHKMYSRPATNLKASAAARKFSQLSVEPQFAEDCEFYPIQGSPGSELLAEDPTLEVRLSFDQVRPFSTPYPNTGGTPDRLLVTDMAKDSLEEQVTDIADTFQTLDMETAEESSLGLFTTLVPVVRNEGTPKERIQLTPVRRSSRIRTRMQNSPCNLMHPPHLCNC